MSMGNIESYYQVVPDNIIKKVVGTKTYNAFIKNRDKFLEANKDAEEAIAECFADESSPQAWGLDDTDQDYQKLQKTYAELTNTFKKESGMNLCLIYPTGDGDCYDDITPYKWYWIIPDNEVWIKKLTKKASKFLEKYGNGAIDTNQRISTYG